MYAEKHIPDLWRGFASLQVQTPHAGEEVLHWGGEAEGPDRRTLAERPPRRGDSGENQVPAHPAQSPADSQRLLQIFPGHLAPVSGGGG